MLGYIKKICSCFRGSEAIIPVSTVKNSHLKHEMVKAHQDLASAKDEAQRKSIVINALSHDIRSPLNNINLQIQVALMYLEDEKNIEYKQEISQALVSSKKSIMAASKLLNTFLEFAKHDTNPDKVLREIFDYNVLCTDLSDTIAKPGGVKVELKCEHSLYINTDRLKLRRIIVNLVDNSIKFTKNGTVKVISNVDREDLIVTVEDNGCGMEADTLNKIFDEFYQIGNPERNGSKGFGLGLSIVKRLVESLSGNVQVESEVGVGTKFTVRIPNVVVSQEIDYDIYQKSPSSGGRTAGEHGTLYHTHEDGLGSKGSIFRKRSP